MKPRLASAEDQIRLAEDARDAAAAGLTPSEIRTLLDRGSYALCRAFPTTRAEFRFRGRIYFAVMKDEVMSIFRTADRLICERRQE
jgi:hypothetical protein